MGSDETTDPADWSVDEVVDFLCGSTLTPWSQSTNAPRPDAAVLEAALRENQITGSVLLNHVDNHALRDDLGLKALGHRSSIMTAIDYLRKRSGKYQFAKSRTSSSDGEDHQLVGKGDRRSVHTHPVSRRTNTSSAFTRSTSHDPNDRNHRLPLPRAKPLEPPFDRLLDQVVTPPNSPALNTPSAAPTSSGPAASNPKAERRKIAPTFVSAPRETAAELPHGLPGPLGHSTSTQETVVQNQPSGPSVSPSTGEEADLSETFPNAPETLPTRTDQQDLGPYALLLEKYPVEMSDEDVLPTYGESGSEGEYDEETWQEIVDEHRELSQDHTVRFAPQACEAALAEFISKHQQSWNESRLPRLMPKARTLWLKSRKGNAVEETKSYHSSTIDTLENRFRKLKEAIFEVEHDSISSLQKACGSLEMTLSSLCEHKWKLSILEQEKCPPVVARPPLAPKTRKPRSHSGAEETLSSSSGSEMEDSMSDFTVGDSDASDNSDIPGVAKPEHRVETDAFQRLSSPSNSEDSDPFHKPSKRPRRNENSKIAEKGTGNPAEFFNDSNIECIDMTASTSEPLMDGDLEIKTPPLNPTESVEQPDMMEEEKFQPESTPLDPIVLEEHHEPPTEDDELQIETPLVNPTPGLSVKSISPSPDMGRNVLFGNSEKAEQPFKQSQNTGSDQMPGDDFLSYDEVFDKVAKMDADNIMDRLELLAKIVSLLSPEELEELSAFFSGMLVFHHQGLVQEALLAMLDNNWEIESDPSQTKLVMRMAALYVSWMNQNFRRADRGFERKHLENSLRNIGEETSTFPAFFGTLTGLVSAFKHWKPKVKQGHETPGEASCASPDVVVLDFEDSPTKPRKRKRRARESKEAKNSQKSAQHRVAAQAKAREAMLQARENRGLSNDDANSQAVTFKEPIIYLDPHIGGSVKPHQLNGIQFMWRELIEDENAQGCLLAHTMGLGKTMQVISLLVTISACAASDNPEIRKQVPERFHRSQTLILGPSSLIQNWENEFFLWMPKENHLGPVRLIYPRGKYGETLERVENIREWNENGGVLVMSYDIFRSLVQNKETKNRGKALDDETHEMVRAALIEGPNIVVADEAHKLKNPSTGIAQMTTLFRTKSRIAMTGSPLSNSLLEYYFMVDWIAPGYLDNLANFRSKFMEPIEDGMFVDCTAQQRRKGLVRLQLLSRILAPKIHRADVSAIAADIPPKHEFVLVIDLSELQKKAYNIYVDTVQSGLSKVVNTQLWSWLYVLQLLCNHPSPFREKLVNRATSFGEILPDSGVPDEIAQLPEPLLQELQQLFRTVPDLEDPNLSHRALLLNRILDESHEVGDKVLVFTQSLPTMDYIEGAMQRTGRKYCRLDGKTPVSKRQAATQNFNDDDAQVYLISTRAGGLGLNIFGANRVVIFDFLWNPSWEQQAIGRAYRLGQKKPVFVYRFIAGGTFEEKMHNKTLFKTQLAVRVVDKRNEIRNAHRANAEYLAPLKEVTHGDSSGAMGKDPQVLDKILTGESREMVLKAILVDSQDDENDRLTAEEQQNVETELQMEQLRRSDPEAFRLKEIELQRELFRQSDQEASRLREEQVQREFHEAWLRQQQFASGPFPHQHLSGRLIPAQIPARHVRAHESVQSATEQVHPERPHSGPPHPQYPVPLRIRGPLPPQQQFHGFQAAVTPTQQRNALLQQSQHASPTLQVQSVPASPRTMSPPPLRPDTSFMPQGLGRSSASPPSRASPPDMAVQEPRPVGQLAPAGATMPHAQFMQQYGTPMGRSPSTPAVLTTQSAAMHVAPAAGSAPPSAPVQQPAGQVDLGTEIFRRASTQTDDSVRMEMSDGDDGN